MAPIDRLITYHLCSHLAQYIHYTLALFVNQPLSLHIIHITRCVGCLCANRRYLSAVRLLNAFPLRKNSTGNIRIANAKHAVRICRFCTPMPFSQGVMVNSTMTERMFRMRTTPMIASPMICTAVSACEWSRTGSRKLLHPGSNP